MTDQLRLPAEPRAGPQLRQVPRADRRAASSRRRRPGRTVTFWLSAPQPDIVTIPAGTQVATVRTETRRGDRRSRRPRTCRSSPSRAGRRSARWSTARRCATTSAALEKGTGFFCFQKVPKPGDALLVGLSEAVPSNAVRLRFKCRHRGRRRRPDQPAARLGGLDGDDWERVRARLRHDRRPQPRRRRRASTCPRGHAASLIAKQRAGWLRARVTEPVEGQPALQRLAEHHGPRRRSPSAARSTAVNAELVDRRGARHLRGRPRPAVRAEARPGRARRRAARSSRSRATRAGTSGRRSPTSPTAGPTTGTSCSTLVDGRGPARAGGAPGRRHAAALRRRAAQGRARSGCARTAPAAAGAATSSPRRAHACSSRRSRSSSRVENRRPGARRRRRRGHRERQGPRPDPAAHPRPRRDHRGLRAARPRGGARGRPGARGGRRRRRRRRLGPRARRPVGRAELGPAAVRPARAQPDDTLQKITDRLEESRGHRHARDRRAARLPRRHGRRQAQGAPAGQPDAAPGGGARRRCTRTSTRSPAAPTAPAGRSAGRSTRARSTRCCRACAAPRSSRTSACSAPTRSPASAASRRSASSSSRTRSSSATSTRSWSRAPDARPRRRAWARRTRWDRALPALYQDDDFAQRLLVGARRGARARLRTIDNFDAYLDPASRPTTSSTGSRAGSGSRSTRAGTRRAGGRSSPGRSSCTGSAGRRPGWPARSRSRPAARSRSSRTARPAGRSTRAASCPGRPSRSSSSG